MKVKKVWGNFIDEKDYQHYFVDRLVKDNGFVRRENKHIDQAMAMDVGMLIEFLGDTQPKAMAALAKTYGAKRDAIIAAKVNQLLTQKAGGGLLAAFKHEVTIGTTKLKLLYRPQETRKNKAASELAAKNVFSVAEEVWSKAKEERVDVVVFVNGLVFASFELKCNCLTSGAGQTVEDSVRQYREHRDPKDRLFLFRAGCLVNFAMDLFEVQMATRLDGLATTFLPFNKGCGEGIERGKGNPVEDDKFPTAYMWEDIFTKPTLLEILTKFIYLKKGKKKDPVTKKKYEVEDMIFPRFHQLECVRSVLADVKKNGTSRNYLIQHSAGSGKTNSIAWLAYRLSSLHDDADQAIFDKVVIMTDRRVVDRQLQKAIAAIDHQNGQIELIDEDKTSADLKKAILGNTPIVATTIQKFPYVLKQLDATKKKRYAVIIDEAHSSTAGMNMAAVTKVLGWDAAKFKDADELLQAELKGLGKQDNVAMFAFTATPKPETLNLFGEPTANGKNGAFHLYSMKQAIEEKFILDVLENYIEYQSFYTIVKKVKDDPAYKSKKAAAKIVRFAMLHETMIAQRVEVIVEHFRACVMNGLGGFAKAMVVTSGREEAVRYSFAISRYIEEKGYTDMRALVAFSSSVKVDGKEYCESGLNGFSEKKLPDKFEDVDENKVLIVADKYQTGFDQPFLSAMYVLKKLRGINAVQTLSRLNRICKPWDKTTFVLDFVNTVDDMKSAFAPYYTATLLVNTVTVEQLYDMKTEIEGAGLVTKSEVDEFWKLSCEVKNPAAQIKAVNICKQSKDRFEKIADETERQELVRLMRRFVKSYNFIVQASLLKDEDMHKLKCFVATLIPMLLPGSPTDNFSLKDKIDAVNIWQKKVKETVKATIVAKPDVALKTGEGADVQEDVEKKLSEIIKDINQRTGKNLNSDAGVKSLLQAGDHALEDEKVVQCALNNQFTDFKTAFVNKFGFEMLAKAYEENKELYDHILDADNEATQDAVLEALAELVYGRIKKSVSAEGINGGVLVDLAAGQASQYDLLAAGNGKMKALGKRAKKSGYKVKAPKKVK